MIVVGDDMLADGGNRRASSGLPRKIETGDIRRKEEGLFHPLIHLCSHVLNCDNALDCASPFEKTLAAPNLEDDVISYSTPPIIHLSNSSLPLRGRRLRLCLHLRCSAASQLRRRQQLQQRRLLKFPCHELLHSETEFHPRKCEQPLASAQRLPSFTPISSEAAVSAPSLSSSRRLHSSHRRMESWVEACCGGESHGSPLAPLPCLDRYPMSFPISSL
uniref:Uncharacterized protein n=1 Tax=Vitis vinifera TaxID=29760 RepID=A5AGG8_VITVI|nr:hypothetical protein VITISV_027096 [Vitis vinifera]